MISKMKGMITTRPVSSFSMNIFNTSKSANQSDYVASSTTSELQ
jgi:hypothetical protein